MTIPPAALELLDSDALAHVVTLNEDGSPHVTLAWVGVDNNEIVIGTLMDQRKLENCRRDPRVSLSIEGTRIHPPGLKEYLVIYGRARVVEGGAADLLQRLAETYIGAGRRFPPMDNPPPGYVTRITVERVTGVGPWVN